MGVGVWVWVCGYASCEYVCIHASSLTRCHPILIKPNGDCLPPHINRPDALCTRFSVNIEAAHKTMHYAIQDTPGYGDDTVRFTFWIRPTHIQECANITSHTRPQRPSFTTHTQDVMKSINMVLRHVDACNARCVWVAFESFCPLVFDPNLKHQH